MKNLTEQQLSNLAKNLQNTNWFEPRIQNGRLVADFYGDLQYPIGGGRYSCYSGTNTFYIYPSNLLINEVSDYGFDQKGFVNKQMDIQPCN